MKNKLIEFVMEGLAPMLLVAFKVALGTYVVIAILTFHG